MDPGKKKKRPRTKGIKKNGPVYSAKKYEDRRTKEYENPTSSGKKTSENSHKVRKAPFSTPDLDASKQKDLFKQKEESSKKQDNRIRLNKYIASSGICSRREADEYIKAGLVTVNDEKVTEMGVKINPGDIVKYKGKRIRTEKKVYLLLNKPKDYVTTLDDPEGRKTVMELIRDAGKERIYPVGRLDRNTTGVLLFTNDGELASRLTHPKHEQKKIYHVFLDRELELNDFKKLASGIDLSDGFIKPDGISYVNQDSKNELGIEIHSGRNRIVRRMFEALNYQVVKLDRVYFAGLTKKNLPRGRWRYLNEKEISYLKMTKKP
ncbi:MAG: pseudouridine synthase [Bacteroidota bacterium]